MDLTDFRKSLPSGGKQSPQISIWAIPFVVLWLAAGVLAWVSYDEYQETLNQEYRFLDAHARIAQNKVTHLVHDVRRVLTQITEELPKYSAQHRAAYSARLVEFNSEVPEIHTLAVVDPTGRVGMAANPRLVGFDGSKREYFTAHQGGPRQFDFHVSRPYKSIYGDYSVGFSLPIHDSEWHLLGIAVAGVHFRYFNDAMKEIRPAQQRSTIAIINDDGEFIYRQPSPITGKNAATNAAFQAYLRSGRAAQRGIAVSATDGIERMYAFQAIAGTPLSIAASRPLDDVLATWRRNLALRVALFFLAGALILRLTLTAQRRQQEALAGRRFTDRLIQTANAMMVAVDSESCVIAVNEATERITGYCKEELVGHSFFETAMPRDRYPRAWERFLHYREAGDVPRAFEAPILTKSGEERVIAWQNSGLFAHGGTQAILSFGIDVTERVQLQQARNRAEISRRLVGIQEEERRRLAVELHDRTSPNLSILDINLKLLADSLPKDTPAGIHHLIEDTSAMLMDTIASIRAVSFDFRPPLLDYAGFWPALQAYAGRFSKRTGIAVRIDGQGMRLDPEVETNLFHVAYEALANCAKHSHAKNIVIRQTFQGGDIALLIADDGIGFDPAGSTAGQGLTMMRQRAEFIGGKLQVDSHPGKGSCIAVTLGAYSADQPWNAPNVVHLPANQASAPSPAARPPAKQAVSR